MNKKTLGILLVVPVLLIVSFILDYIFLPAWNLQSFNFWMILAVGVVIVLSLGAVFFQAKKVMTVSWTAGGVIFLIALVASVGSWLFWPGNDILLSKLLPITEFDGASFSKDFPGASLTSTEGNTILLPSLDKELSIKIAQGKLGPYGAQFQMDPDIFTSVNVIRDKNQQMVRISPLDYSGFMVALSSGSKGTPGYLEVAQGTGEGRLVPVEGGMKYTPGALFNYDLARHLRFTYRTALFGGWNFEIDDAGNPWWVVPVMENRAGLFAGSEIIATVLVNPISGESAYYIKGTEPVWVDRVVPSELVLEQANNALSLKNGWFNQILGEKKEVFQLSDGYNYISTVDGLEGKTWLISGITSPNEADQTVIGFLMVDLKTKETRRYSLTGITEMRAMEIAQNDERVRAQALTPTWPIVMEVQGTPAYFLMLKNDVQRQRFALVDVANGTLVAMADNLSDCQTQFAGMMGVTSLDQENLLTVDGIVSRVRDNYDGTSSFLLAGDPANRYIVNNTQSNGILFMSPGDNVVITYRTQLAVKNQRLVVELRNVSIGE